MSRDFAEPVPSGEPLRFEDHDSRTLVSVNGTDELLRCDTSAVVVPTR